MVSIEKSIFQNSTIYSNKIAIKTSSNEITYKQLWLNIISAKNYIQSLNGFNTAKTIVIAAEKQFDFIYAYFGAHLAGLTVIPLDPDTNSKRLSLILNTTEPFCLIGFDSAETSICKIPYSDFENISKLLEVDECEVFPSMNSVCDILFTTGTTGLPKAVPLTFENEASAVENINTFIGNTSDDTELLALPVCHSFGLGRLRCCLAKGQTVFFIPNFVNIKRFFRIIEEEKITGLAMVPSSWNYIKKMTGDKLKNFTEQIHYIEMGSAYLSKDDKLELSEIMFKTKVCMHYGLTEASRSTFLDFHKDINNLDSIGLPSPGVEIKIFNENGIEVPAENEGEICIKGLHVTKGYLNVSNDECFFQDFFKTGDWGYKDKAGYLYLKSRKKELINVGGKKLAPQEVENELLAFNIFNDVACIGVPDSNGLLGEVVKAFIVSSEKNKLSLQEIQEKLSGKLEGYKIPAEVEYVDIIPRTQNGKIQRGLLKNDKDYR